MKIDFFKISASIITCQLIGVVGSFFTRSSVRSQWYLDLKKPGIQPPDWVFAPVWITLFCLMGISLYLIWKLETTPGKTLAISLFLIQSVFNILWSFLFFYLRNPLLALIEIVFLLVLIIVTALLFYRLNKAAGIFMVPYIMWVGFAAVLNFLIVKLN